MDLPAVRTLPKEQKQRLHEVSDELLNIYKTLVKMRFVDYEALVVGPHKIDDKLMAEYEKCGLDPAVIYLYSIMPYINEKETAARDFFQGCAFFNPLDIHDVRHGRDPRYCSPEGSFDDEEGQYMHPWYTILSCCSNHSSFIIYDTKEHRIWIIDQIDGRTTDPVFCKWYAEPDSAKAEANTWGDSGSSNWSGDDSSDEEMDFSDGESHGSSEFWDDEDDIAETRELDVMVEDQSEIVDYDEGFEHVEELDESERQEAAAIKNNNSLELVRSRPAGDVLRDINNFYRTLKELPGGGEHNGGDWPKPEILRPLYLNNGWPDSFDAERFEVDLARALATEKARYSAEQPLREVECYEGWSEGNIENIKRREQEIVEAETVDDEWMARFELWKAKEQFERNQKDLQKARDEAGKLCPGAVCQRDEDLPLWEMDQIRSWVDSGRTKVERDEGAVAEQTFDNPMQKEFVEAGLKRARKELKVNERALTASKADAERMCPGRNFEEVIGHKSLRPHYTLAYLDASRREIEYSLRHIQSVREFAATVPPNATTALAATEEEIQGMEESLARSRMNIERTEKWVAEHGDS
jgi:hypothetical protein